MQTKDIAVGTELALRDPYSQTYTIITVEKISQSGRLTCLAKGECRVTLNPDLTVRGDDGGRWGKRRATDVTDKIREGIQRRHFLALMRSASVADLPIESIKQIVAIVEEAKCQSSR